MNFVNGRALSSGETGIVAKDVLSVIANYGVWDGISPATTLPPVPMGENFWTPISLRSATSVMTWWKKKVIEQRRKSMEAKQPTRHITPLILALILIGTVGSTVATAAQVKTTVRGIATWYDQKSCQREGTSGIFTASGERYDETAFTLALPHRNFGKPYRVCNAQTGRCAVARHNDIGPGRGPRARGVIADLTPAVFDALGGVRGCKAWGCWGEMPVTVEAME